MSDGGAIVGSVQVDVLPSADLFGNLLKEQLASQADLIGQQIGDQIGVSIADAIKTHVSGDSSGGGLLDDETVAEEGDLVGEALAERIRQHLEDAYASLPAVDLNVNSAAADLKIALVRQELADLSYEDIGVTVSADEALATLAALRGDLEFIAAAHVDPTVNVDAAKALVELELVSAKLDEIQAKANAEELAAGVSLLGEDALTAAAGIDVAAESTGRWSDSLGNAATKLSDTAGQVPTLLGVIALLLPFLAPVAAALGAIAGSAIAATGGLALFAVLAEPLASLASGMSGLTGAWEQFKAAAQPEILAALVSLFQALAAALPSLTPIIDAFSAAIGGIGTELQGVFQSPAWLAFTQYIATEGVSALTAFVQILLNLGEAFGAILEALQPVSDAILTMLVNWSQSLANWSQSNGFESFAEYVQKEGPQIVVLIGEILDTFGKLIAGAAPIAAVMIPVLEKLFQILNDILSIPGMSTFIAALITIAGAVVVLAVPLGALGAALSAAGVAAEGAGAAFALSAPEILLVVAAVIAAIFIVDELVQHWAGVSSFIGSVWDSAVSGTEDAMDHVIEAIEYVPDHIGDLFADAGKWLYDIGGNIVDGLANGIQNAWDGFIDGLKSDIEAIPDAFRSLLGIASPSRVMAEIGGYITDGLVLGINNGSGDVVNAAAGLNGKIVSTLSGYASGTAGGLGVSTAATTDVLEALHSIDDGIRSALPDALSEHTGQVVSGVMKSTQRAAVVTTRQG